MAINDLSNKEQMTLDFFKAILKHEFPSLDLSDTGAFMEMVGLPMLKMTKPFLDYADKVSLLQSIDNAPYLTKDEMNKLLAKEYTTRFPGKRAAGYGTLIFRDVPPNNQVQIFAGVVGLSKTGLRFVSKENVLIDESRLGNYYDADSFRFKIPVLFEADNVGSNYNLEPGDLAKLELPISYLESITNELPFTGGEDEESNLQAADRLRKTARTRGVSTNRGYKRFIRDNFRDVQDVLVVGFNHPLMQRDIIGTVPVGSPMSQTVKNVHWGTKTDLYIRGQKFLDSTEYLRAQTIPNTTPAQIGIKLTNVPVYDVSLVTLTSTDPAADPNTLLVTNYALQRNEDAITYGTAQEEIWIAIADARVVADTNVKVTYRYNSLLLAIDEKLYGQDDRPTIVDIMVKEANQRYILGGMIIKQMGAVSLRDNVKSQIRQRAFQFIDTISMGGEVQFSDISDEVVRADTSGKLVDYVRFPYQFLVLENQDKHIFYCLSQKQRKLFDDIAAANVFFQKALAAYKYEITIYDLMDCLHLLTYDSGLDNALTGLTAEGSTWPARVTALQDARKIMVKGEAIRSLSPAQSFLEENAYFALSYLSLYEDKFYTKDDWRNLITLIENLSVDSTGSITANNPLYLTCFCLAIIYLALNEDKLSGGIQPFLDYFKEVAKGTPIEGSF